MISSGANCAVRNDVSQSSSPYGIVTGSFYLGTSKVLARKLNAVLEDLKSDETRQAIAYHKAFVTHVNEVDPNQTTLLSTLSLVIDSAGKTSYTIF